MSSRILILCTANMCRSPMAQGLLRARLAMFGIDDAQVHSAGMYSRGVGRDGERVPTFVMTAMEPYGVDVAGHRSRQVSRELIEGADLVIAMAGEHVRDAIALAPDAWSRVYTLKELVRRGEATGARHPDEQLRDWVGRLGPGDTAAGGGHARDDITDPIGGPLRGYQRTAEDLDVLLERLVELVWGGRSPFA